MLLKRVSFVIATGIATAVGIAVGFGPVDRLLIRLVAIREGAPVAFSWEGTAGILVAIAVFNLPAALAFAALPRRGRWVGCLLAILATTPHWINLLGTVLHFGD